MVGVQAAGQRRVDRQVDEHGALTRVGATSGIVEAGHTYPAVGTLQRREGLHEADLERFRKEMIDAANAGSETRKRSRGPTAEQRRIKQLEKELKRKDKAIAEAAALAVLSKKVRALFPSEEEGESTDESNE